MSKAVMISIQPKWCELIASGRKTVEVRKTSPKLDTPFKCYIYQTNHKWLYDILIRLDRLKTAQMLADGRCKIIGEFVCDKILDCRDVPLEPTCLTVDEWLKYTDDHKGPVYGWHVSALKIYDKPLELCEFFKPCIKDEYPWCFDCERGLTPPERPVLPGLRSVDVPCGGWLKRPPQSWCYVQELVGGSG